jgi:hypothetical protein
MGPRVYHVVTGVVMPSINTQVCTLKGCCVPTQDRSKGSAWSESAAWWFCQKEDFCRNCLCGTFCLPCQIGVLATDSRSDWCLDWCPEWCPGDWNGFCNCAAFSLFAECFPLIALFIECGVVDRVNNGEHVASCEICSCIKGDGPLAACLWASFPLCTCAHCIIAEQAKEKGDTSTSTHYAKF